MLTHEGRRTTHDDGRQLIAIGHLSDSGDLKITDSLQRDNFFRDKEITTRSIPFFFYKHEPIAQIIYICCNRNAV